MLSQNEVSGLWLMACNGRKDEKLDKNDFKLVGIRAPRGSLFRSGPDGMRGATLPPCRKVAPALAAEDLAKVTIYRDNP